MAHLIQLTLLVRDYDEAIAFYVGVLGFTLAEDADMGDGKRWVVVRPPGSSVGQAGLLLAQATTPEQQARVGDQTGGRVFLFLHTDDLRADYARWSAGGVEFVEEPRSEEYGLVVVFKDLYGNLWDLIQRTP